MGDLQKEQPRGFLSKLSPGQACQRAPRSLPGFLPGGPSRLPPDPGRADACVSPRASPSRRPSAESRRQAASVPFPSQSSRWRGCRPSGWVLGPQAPCVLPSLSLPSPYSPSLLPAPSPPLLSFPSFSLTSPLLPGKTASLLPSPRSFPFVSLLALSQTS